MAARTSRGLQVTMPQNPFWRDLKLLRQPGEKARNRCQLSSGRGRLLEIPDQAYSDAKRVVQSISGMGAGKLFRPAKRRFHLTVRHAFPVADHEMIPNPQPTPARRIRAPTMDSVDALDVPRAGCRVMDDDVLPVAGGRAGADAEGRRWQVARIGVARLFLSQPGRDGGHMRIGPIAPTADQQQRAERLQADPAAASCVSLSSHSWLILPRHY